MDVLPAGRLGSLAAGQCDGAAPLIPRSRCRNHVCRPQVESYFFDMRRQLWEYDQVLNTQRDKVYGERRRALESDDLSAQMVEYAERTVDDILEVKSLSSQLFTAVSF